MTRIRKNWSSSRGSEDPESPPPHFVVTDDSHMVDVEGKPPSPFLLQLVDEDAMHMLAAVSLESLEHDSGIRNLKRENASAQVIAAMKAKPHGHDLGMRNIKHETTSTKIWDRPFLQGGVLLSKRSKSDQWYQKLSALCCSDGGLVSSPYASTRREMVDEEQSKSSSVADNEMVDSDLSARVELAKQSMAVAEPMQGLISELLQAHCLEREPSNEETSRVLQELVFGRGTGRKRRQKPWESELNLPATVLEGYSTDEKTQKSVNSEGCVPSENNKRRVKSLRAPQDQGSGDRNKIRVESGQAVTEMGNGNKLWFKSEKFVSDIGDSNQPLSKAAKVGNDVDDKNHLKPKLEKVGNAVDDRKKQRAKSLEVGNDVGDRKKLRPKSQKIESGAQKGGPEDIFPKGWKYKGLAQIAEKDEATNGQVKKLCGRTDGHNWRCPLRVVEGMSLCQHHLNKARAKKMGKTNQQRKQLEKKKDEASASPRTLDSSSFKPSIHSDHHVPTKLRRRHKTAKLSVL